MSIQTFVLTPTEWRDVELRVESPYYDGGKVCNGETHSAVRAAGRFEFTPDRSLFDGKWPAKCDACDHVFGDRYDLYLDETPLYRRSDNGDLVSWREAPAGAVLDAEWLRGQDGWSGDDGKAVIVICPENPDGTGRRAWHVDSRASNCTMPEDKTHKCWCRHGPLECLTVDKNCTTCKAGAGSIWMNAPSGWHGFLTAGKLVRC